MSWKKWAERVDRYLEVVEALFSRRSSSWAAGEQEGGQVPAADRDRHADRPGPTAERGGDRRCGDGLWSPPRPDGSHSRTPVRPTGAPSAPRTPTRGGLATAVSPAAPRARIRRRRGVLAHRARPPRRRGRGLPVAPVTAAAPSPRRSRRADPAHRLGGHRRHRRADRPDRRAVAPDGRIFVAEKGGRIKVFDGLDDRTATVVADLPAPGCLTTGTGGLLGFNLDPSSPACPTCTSSTRTARPSAASRRWGDTCPTPPGPLTNGCVISTRLSRFALQGTTSALSRCSSRTGARVPEPRRRRHRVRPRRLALRQQGRRRQLHVQRLRPVRCRASHGRVATAQPPGPPCRRPPPRAGRCAPRTCTTADHSASTARSSGSTAPPERACRPSRGRTTARQLGRVIAYGLRSPFPLSFHPATGDLTSPTWAVAPSEEVERLTDPGGWPRTSASPCYEGAARMPAYDGMDLDLCEHLYAQPEADQPGVHLCHDAALVPGESLPVGSSSLSGIAFYDGGDYPDEYDGALLLADYSRNCIWALPPGVTP